MYSDTRVHAWLDGPNTVQIKQLNSLNDHTFKYFWIEEIGHDDAMKINTMKGHFQASLIWGFPILPILSSYGEKK